MITKVLVFFEINLSKMQSSVKRCLRAKFMKFILEGRNIEAVYIPNMLRMAVDHDVVSSGCVVGDRLSTRLLQNDVLRADGVLQSLRRLRRCHCRISGVDHLVVGAFVASHVNRERIVAQRFHLIDGQVSVRLVGQSGVFACW